GGRGGSRRRRSRPARGGDGVSDGRWPMADGGWWRRSWASVVHRPSSTLQLPGHEPHAVLAVALGEADADLLAGRRRDRPPDEVGADGELAEAAVDEGEEADGGGPAEVHHGVERGARGAPGVDDVVDEDEAAGVDVERDVRRLDDGRAGRLAEVFPVERGVEDAEGEADALEGLALGAEPAGEEHPARLHPDEGEALGRLGLVVEVLDDLAGEAGERAVDVGRVHEPRLDGVGGGEQGHGAKLRAGPVLRGGLRMEERRWQRLPPPLPPSSSPHHTQRGTASISAQTGKAEA